MLKLEHGSSAVGVSLVSTKEELIKRYRETTTLLKDEDDFGGIGLGFGNEMFVTEFHKGSEHDIDLVLFDRKLVAAYISDNGPTNIPSFTGTFWLEACSWLLLSCGLRDVEVPNFLLHLALKNI